MQNRAIVFVIFCNLDGRRLKALLAEVELLNRCSSVSSVALVDGGRVLFYMEGLPADLGVAFSTTVDVFGQSDVIELARGWIGPRRFPSWSMRCICVLQGDLLRIVRANWVGLTQRVGTTTPESGMEILAELVLRSHEH
nr:F420H(2):quinone oxidoreductase [Stenotrophomonas pavanii]